MAWQPQLAIAFGKKMDENKKECDCSKICQFLSEHTSQRQTNLIQRQTDKDTKRRDDGRRDGGGGSKGGRNDREKLESQKGEKKSEEMRGEWQRGTMRGSPSICLKATACPVGRAPECVHSGLNNGCS